MDAALLIDLGDGSVLDCLAKIGVAKVEWVLFTHHHREQSQGAHRLRGAKTAAPEGERKLFERPLDYRKMQPTLEDEFSVYGSSYVRPPLPPVPIDLPLEPSKTFVWRNHEILCLGSPGNSPGSMSYVIVIGNRRIAFTGDVILDGARMHTWYDTEWDYGYGAGIDALRNTCKSLASQQFDLMLPSHGPAVANPKRQLSTYAGKLEKLARLYVRGYDVEDPSTCHDNVSEPTAIPDLAQVSPHLFKLKGKDIWVNFCLILSDGGHGLVVDCGLLDEPFLDKMLEDMRLAYGLHTVDAVLVTHMHGDHFLEAPHLRDRWGAQVWALDNMVDKMEHPERFDYTCGIQTYGKNNPDGTPMTGVQVDRVFTPGETFDWEGYRFTVDWMPGQTEFALCMHGQIDGRLVAFTGDNLFGDPANPNHSGHEAVVCRNSAVMEEGYILCAEYLKRLNPDILIGGHSFVMDKPAAFIERFRKWSYEMRRCLITLNSELDYRLWYDPFWVRAEPYRLALHPGGLASVDIHVRNFLRRKQKHDIKFIAPPGIVIEPVSLEGVLPRESRGRFPIQVKAAANALSTVHIVGMDIALDGRRYGERFDFLVAIE